MNEPLLLAFLYYFNWFVFFYFVFWNSIYLGFCILAFFHVRNYVRELRDAPLRKIFKSAFHKPISVLVPAFNEEESIVETVRSTLNLEYPEFEVVVINDGSRDETVERLRDEFDLVPSPSPSRLELPCAPIREVLVSRIHPNLVVIDKEHGGKADSLNAALSLAKHELFCTTDADSVLERDCLLKVSRPFLLDERTVAVGGTIRISNGCNIQQGENTRIELPDSHLARFQIVEYLRAFLFGRVGLQMLNCLMLTSGAFSLYKKQLIIEIGGFRLDSVSEDMELICRLHWYLRRKRVPYRVTFVPDPVCWTEVPETFAELAKQRNRWHRGLIQALIWTRTMLLNPRYGTVGMIGMPFFVFFEMFGPIIELLGYVALVLALYLGVVNWPFALLFATLALLLGLMLSVTSVLLEELSFRRYPRFSQLLELISYGIVENFGYRQLTMLYRLKGTIDHMRGRRSWDPTARRDPDEDEEELDAA